MSCEHNSASNMLQNTGRLTAKLQSPINVCVHVTLTQNYFNSTFIMLLFSPYPLQ